MRAFRMATAVALLLVTAAGTAAAQGRGRGREHAPGQMKKAERAAEMRFTDTDREYARNWYLHERRGGAGLPPGLRGRELPPGLRDRDELPPGLERRLAPGYVIEPDYRPQLYPIPVELQRRFAPPPEGYVYFTFFGNVVMVNAGFRVADVIRLGVSVVR